MHSRNRRPKCACTLIIILLFIREVVVQPDVSIIRSCQDDRIIEHFKNNGHSYCFHACGKLGVPGTKDTTVCTSDGDCLCMDPCTNNQTVTQSTFKYSTEICNPPSRVGDPADPDVHFHPQCISRCASRCPFGTGAVCGETTKFQSNPIFVKICTCHCPVQRCPGSDPPQVITINNNTSLTVVTILNSYNTTNTNNNNTTVLVSPPVQPGLPVVLVDPLASLEKVEWKLVLTKLFQLGWLMVKVYGVVVLQMIVVGIYSLLFYVFIS